MVRFTRNTVAVTRTGTFSAGTAGFKVFTHKNSRIQGSVNSVNDITLSGISPASADPENELQTARPMFAIQFVLQKSMRSRVAQPAILFLHLASNPPSVHSGRRHSGSSHKMLFFKEKSNLSNIRFFCYNKRVNCCRDRKQFLLFSRTLCLFLA